MITFIIIFTIEDFRFFSILHYFEYMHIKVYKDIFHPIYIYRAFHRFGQAKFPDSGLVLGSSLFSILP